MLSAAGDPRLVYPRPTMPDAALILPHAYAHAHTSSSTAAHARRAACCDHAPHTRPGPRQAARAHPEAHPTDPATSRAHVPAPHVAYHRYRAHHANAGATYSAHAESPHAHARHQDEAANHAHATAHHAAERGGTHSAHHAYIIDMSLAPALFMDMKDIPLPIGAAFPAATWPLLKLLFGVVAACLSRC